METKQELQTVNLHKTIIKTSRIVMWTNTNKTAGTITEPLKN
jgi:hypothetical protein